MIDVAQICEIIMLCIFGASWPFNISKSIHSRTAKGKSVMFEILVVIGYGFGLYSKIWTWQQGGAHSPACRAFIRCLWQSSAKLAIVPIQDLCGYGGDTKMNRPGRAEGNWTFRITDESLQSIDTDWLLEMNRIYKRLS